MKVAGKFTGDLLNSSWLNILGVHTIKLQNVVVAGVGPYF